MKIRVCVFYVGILLFSGCVRFQHQTSETEPHAVVAIAPDSGSREQAVVKKIDGRTVRPGREYRVAPCQHQIIIMHQERFDETFGPWIDVGNTGQTSPTMTISQSDDPELSGYRPPPFAPSIQSLDVRAEGWVIHYITNSIMVKAGWRYRLDGERVSKSQFSGSPQQVVADETYPGFVSKDGVTPLHVAAFFGQDDVVELLISRGAQLDPKDSHGATPLHYAITGPTARSMIESMEETLPVVARQDGGKYCRVADLLISRGAAINVTNNLGNTPLHLAIAMTNAPMVEVLIATKVGLNVRDKKGSTALNLAAFGGNEAIIKLLLEAGADPNIVDTAGFTPLHTAIEHKHFNLVPLFLKHHADPGRTCRNGSGPLHKAAAWGDLEAMGQLLEAGASVNAVSSGGTPLSQAVTLNQKSAVEFLLERGAKPNLAPQLGGLTALHWAAVLGHHEIAEVLLAAGANVNKMSRSSGTPLHSGAIGRDRAKASIGKSATSGVPSIMPVFGSHEDYADTLRVLMAAKPNLYLRDPNYGRTVLGVAAQAGNEMAVDQFLKAGVDVNASSKQGATPLHEAALIKGHPQALSNIVVRLIQAGANIEARDKSRGTPLHAAANFGQPVMVKLLLGSGASIDVVGPDGCTPLHLALVRNNQEVMRLLLEGGSDPDTRFGANSTALMFSSERGSLHTVKQLLEWDADVSATNQHGFTALSMAARMGHLKVIDSLVNAGASVGSVDKVGFTPLHEAADRGHADVVELLLEKGANPEARDKHGATPLGVAANGVFDEERFYVAVAEALLAQGANVNARRDNGQIPLHRTAEWGRPIILQTLLDAGADRTARDNNGKTAQDIANEFNDPGLRRDVAAGRKECAKLLSKAHIQTIARPALQQEEVEE